MPTSTPRLALSKPEGNELVDEDTDLNNNWDKIDAAVGLFVCTSAARPASPYQGQQIFETDTGLARFWTGTKWFDCNPRVVRKSTSEAVASSTTLQDDDVLTIPIAANDNFTFDCVIRYQAATAADLKLQVQGPAASTIRGSYIRLTSTAASNGDDRLEELEGSTDIVAGGLGSTTPVTLLLKGIITNGINAGAVKIQWAQFASSATATDVLSGSFIKLHQYG